VVFTPPTLVSLDRDPMPMAAHQEPKISQSGTYASNEHNASRQARKWLGVAAAARVRMIVWCKECQHHVEPDPAEVATWYGVETTVLDWRERLVCSRRPAGRHGGDRRRVDGQ
jgi:hypothetical protein